MSTLNSLASTIILLELDLTCGGSAGAPRTDAEDYEAEDFALGAVILRTGTQLHTMNPLQMRSTEDDEEDAARSLASKAGQMRSCLPYLL